MENLQFEYKLSPKDTIILTKYIGQSPHVEIPENIDGKPVTELYFTFYHNHTLKSVVIPKSIRVIGDAAFDNCTSLKTVRIPNGVKMLDFGAFNSCTSLRSVSIPKSLRIIISDAFCGCRKLKKWRVSPNNPYFSSLGCCLLSKDRKTLYSCPSASGTFVIPECVRRIRREAFCLCIKLKSVLIHNKVRWIGPFAFSCTLLRSFVFPPKVKRIKYGTFATCKNLKNISFPINIEVIEDRAFDGCLSLESVLIPDNIKEIEFEAFQSCYNLKSVVFLKSSSDNDDTITLGHSVFSLCSSLKYAFLSKRVKEISSHCFSYCGDLKIVIPESVKHISEDAFMDCSNLTIYAPRGSEAERFATQHNISFIEWNSDEDYPVMIY